MSKSTKNPATPELDAAGLAYQKLLAKQRQQIARNLRKRRRQKSHQ